MKYVLCFLISLFVLACEPEGQAANGLLMQDKLVIETQDGKKHKFNVELALSPQQIQQGLMWRNELAPDAGMLFWFGGEESLRSFWMKNTLIPLDMVFIKKNGVIHHIHSNARPRDLTGVSSQGPVAAVLELKGGRAEDLGLKPGDTVKQRFFK